MTNSRPTTDAEAYVRDAQHAVELIATSLVKLAERLRREAVGFSSEGQAAVSLAADIVDEYTQQTGQLGQRLWQLIKAAGAADNCRKEDA